MHIVGLLHAQNFKRALLQSLKTQGGKRETQQQSDLLKLYDSACLYCGIVARTKFQQGLASVLKDTGRREGKLKSNNNYNKVYFSLQIYIYISDLLKLYDSACLYCGIVARTKFQQGLVSVLEDMGRREGKLNGSSDYVKVYFSSRICTCPAEAVQLSVPVLWDCCSECV